MAVKTENTYVHWFPGHMAKAGRMISDNLKMVDAVCEILDARIPFASRNPDIGRLAGDKPGIIVLNRADLADPAATSRWKKYFTSAEHCVMEADSRSGKGVAGFRDAVSSVLGDRIEANAARGQAGRAVRVMVLGIPNVGKSTFINKLAGRKAAAAADRPGVTRGRQWISVGRGLELLDTPGILWPRFDDREVGELLALTGAVKDDVFDRESLAAGFLARMMNEYPSVLAERYRIGPDDGMTGWELLEAAARRRGFLMRGGVCDTERMAAVLLNEYRAGKLGRLTLEFPPEA